MAIQPSQLEIDNIVAASGLRLSNPTVPASSTDTGTQGDISWDSNYLYVCTSGDTWKRAAMSTWLDLPVSTNVELWLDANDSSTITLNGSTVSQWDDKSGNNYHISQATASNQPAYVTSVLNSKNIVRFDGVNDIMSNASAQPVAGSASRTIFYVFSCNTTFTGWQYEYGLYFGLASPVDGGVIAISQELAVRVSNGYRIFNQSNDDGSHAIISAVQDGTNVSNYSMWKNGSALSATTTRSRALNIGPGIHLGAHPVIANWFDGDIAEVIVYSSALSTSDRESVESYLSDKWGIT